MVRFSLGNVGAPDDGTTFFPRHLTEGASEGPEETIRSKF